MHRGQRFAVALSGGVDSATAAALLVAEGHEVIGFSMRLYDAAGTAASAGGRCCGPVDLEDARAVCAHLGIPFYVVDETSAFRRAVIDDFAAEYAAGRTPNPCVRCNEQVKFAPLLARSRAIGAQGLVTGHYARVEGAKGARRLYRAADASKDQSYFLFAMGRSALEEVHFPLGQMSKQEVRAAAKAMGLPNADKPDSQEICFVPDGNYAAAVEAALPGEKSLAPGDVVDGAGTVLGQHTGIHNYTVGQRRGLQVAGMDRGGAPLYVVRLDAGRRQVVLGTKSDLEQQSFVVDDVRWLVDRPFGSDEVLSAEVQIRHRHRPVACRVARLHAPAYAAPGASDDPPASMATSVRVELERKEAAITPGQAAVFYQGDLVLGGGWISSPKGHQGDLAA